MIKHIVIFKYKHEATPDRIREITDAFRALRDGISGVLSFEHGVNVSPEGKSLGFTHVYALTFEDAQARDRYLPHPEHTKFVEFVERTGVVEDVFVVDYQPMG